MSGRNGGHLKVSLFSLFLLLGAGILSACGQKSDAGNQESVVFEKIPEENKAAVDTDSETEVGSGQGEKGKDGDDAFVENHAAEISSEALAAADLKKRFGENCIAEQTFEVELSEYDGKVYFVPFAPSENHPAFSMQMMQDDNVLADIHPYVPDGVSENEFGSLDAVSFYDVNYDGNTDIVLVETYGNTSFAAVYYGFAKDAWEYDRYFLVQEELSRNLSGQLEQLSVSGIRHFLSDGKKNGEFTCYQEAYEAVSRLCELEDKAEKKYSLIYVDDDEIPELVSAVNGYYVSLYTYHDGTVFQLMDSWGYGAMGNAGYEYAERKNSLRNYNADFAGAILHTAYMKISGQHLIDVVAQIDTYNFDDANRNGMPDEEEEESLGRYSASYIDGAEVTDDACAAYDAGEYEYIQGVMGAEDLKAELGRGR